MEPVIKTSTNLANLTNKQAWTKVQRTKKDNHKGKVTRSDQKKIAY